MNYEVGLKRLEGQAVNVSDIALDVLADESIPEQHPLQVIRNGESKLEPKPRRSTSLAAPSPPTPALPIKIRLKRMEIVASRIAANWGLDIQDIPLIVGGIGVGFLFLGQRPNDAAKLSIASSSILAVPYMLLRYKTSRAFEYWVAHRVEIHDGDTSPLAYMVGVLLASYSTLVPALVMGSAVSFWILGWPWGSFIQVTSILILYQVTCLQLGKVLFILLPMSWSTT